MSIKKNFVVGSVITGLLITPAFAEAQQKRDPSTAVMREALRSANRYHHRHLPQDRVRMVQAVRTMLEDMDESGYTEKVQEYILSHEAELINGLTAQQLDNWYEKLKPYTEITKAEFISNMTNNSLSQRKATFEFIKANGLKKVFELVINQTTQIEDKDPTAIDFSCNQDIRWYIEVGMLYASIAMLAITTGPEWLGFAFGLTSAGVGGISKILCDSGVPLFERQLRGKI